MLRIGRRQRVLANAIGHYSRPMASRPVSVKDDIQRVVQGLKSRPGFMQRGEDAAVAVNVHEPLEINGFRDNAGNTVSADSSYTNTGVPSTGGLNGSTGFGGNNAKVDRFNPVYDDLSRGTVAEDWIPRDPRLQNRMFRMMFARGAVEGPVVETISELVWSDFDIGGIQDKTILNTYQAAKEAVKVDRYLPDITKEHLVIGRAVVQLVLDPTAGLWTDMVIHDADYLKIGIIPRTGFMPKIDLMPNPELQAWARSTDPRDMEAKKGLPKVLIDQFAENRPVPLDPKITAYLPRRSFFNDIFGTSFYVRNIPLWGLEKAMINATLTGYRRRSGPITQIAVGSEEWEPTPEQIDALVSAYTAAEEDSVSSTIGTRYDVAFNQIRGGLNEMWKWSDEFAFIKEAKLAMFGVSEMILTGEFNIDTTTAPTIFLERLKAHRKYIVDTFLMQKFFRSLATVHGFVKRSSAELSHRIRIENDDREIVLPTLAFHRNLDVAADTARADLLEKMEEKGLPVSLQEWNRTLGGGDLMARMKSSAEDIELRLKAMKLMQTRAKVVALSEGLADNDKLEEEVDSLLEELKEVNFAKDENPEGIAKLSKSGKERAKDIVEGMDFDVVSDSAAPKVPRADIQSVPTLTASAQVYTPSDTKIHGSPDEDLAMDRSQMNRDPNTLSKVGQVL
jgi:hypothetical protein